MRFTRGFTLIEIMIVLAIIGIVVAIAVPTWLRQREQSRGRACQENLAKLDGAIELYAVEFRLSNGQSVTIPDLVAPAGAGPNEGYLKATPTCPAGGEYTVTNVGITPTCDIGSSNVGFPPHVLP